MVGVAATTEAAPLAFFALFALQHRGQEAAGIAVSDGQRARLHKDVGLVGTVFTAERMADLTGHWAIGHTRYSTTGASGVRNAQPFLVETRRGPLALAHNGNLVNSPALREGLLDRGFSLTASSDTEVMLLMLAGAAGGTGTAGGAGPAGDDSWAGVLAETMPAWLGAYSVVLLGADEIVAARDPWGFRPLSVGRLRDGGHAIASETCALRTLGATDITEVAPGEIVRARGGTLSRWQVLPPQPTSARCTFEFVYFSRPDSRWDDRSVHLVRQRLGEQLAASAPVAADVVIPVPDSAIPAAVGYSRISGIPFNDGLIKNRYIGRTFIEPTQVLREQGVALKFNTLAENLAGRRVVLIDDSLVRGTTAGRLVALLREAGAIEVHLRITCPPITHACHFGVDMGHADDLISARLGIDELRSLIDCDTLAFLSLAGMMAAVGHATGYCNACFTGHYPIPVTGSGPKDAFERVLR